MAEEKKLTKHIPPRAECPRCGGSGKDKYFPNMSCGGCNGTGTTQEELCKWCLHPVRNHIKHPNIGIVVCNAESASGSYLCGCQMSDTFIKPVCNVCGKKCGNCYGLEKHLSESVKCREGYKQTFY